MARYLKIFLLTTLTVAFGVTGVNVLVDPYRLFRPEGWAGFNRVKPYASHEQLMAKLYLAEWMKAKALILGNSRAEVGLDPGHPAWPVMPVLNLAVPGTELDQSLAYLRHAVAIEKPDLVVLGVDFMDFRVTASGATPWEQKHQGAATPDTGSSDTSYPFLVYPDGRTNSGYSWQKWRYRLAKTFSLNAFWHSLETLYAQHSAYAENLTELGFNPMRDYDKIAMQEGYHALFLKRDIENLRSYQQGAKAVFMAGRRSSPVFDRFREAVRICQDRNIRLIVIIYPYHAHLLETFSATGLWPAFEEWKRELTTLLEQAGTGTLWDFSGYHRYAVETVPAAGDKATQVQWYWEAGHFKKALGDVILNRILGAQPAEKPVPEDFGVVLTSINIEAHLADIRKTQAEYRVAHAEELADITARTAAR